MRRWISAAKTRYRSASTAIRSPNEWTFSVSSKRSGAQRGPWTGPGGGRVCDVAQDGASTLITRGVLNLTHRDGHRRPEPLEPDRRYRVRFPLHAIGYSIPAGHRLRVAIAPTCWPIVWPSRTGRWTVFMPGSGVHFPVLVGAADTQFPFAEPLQARNFRTPWSMSSKRAPIRATWPPGRSPRSTTARRATSAKNSANACVITRMSGISSAFSRRLHFRHCANGTANPTVRGDWHTSVVATGEITC